MKAPNRSVLLVIPFLLALLISACDGGTATVVVSGNTPTASADTATATLVPPTDTPIPPPPTPVPAATSCAQATGFTTDPLASAGAHFTDVVFPQFSVGHVDTTYDTNGYQYQVIDACSNSQTTGSIDSFYATNLITSVNGWVQTNIFPLRGDPNASCGDAYCWKKDTGPTRYVGLEHVQDNGHIATFRLRVIIPPLSSGTATLHGTYFFNFDAGIQESSGSDVFWEQIDAVQRRLVAQGTAGLFNFAPATNFANVTYGQLAGVSYSASSINGSNDSTNHLPNGDVFAVHTNGGHYTKVLVVTYGYDLQLQWVTYAYTF